MITQLMRKYWMRKTPPIRQTEVLFYGDNHVSRIDDRGRLYVPVSMAHGRTSGRVEEGLLENDTLYVRREVYGIYVTLLTQEMENYYVSLPYDDPWRKTFFRGNFVALKKPTQNGRGHSKRMGLDIRLSGMEVIVEPNGDFFKILLMGEDLTRLDWANFTFARNALREREE